MSKGDMGDTSTLTNLIEIHIVSRDALLVFASASPHHETSYPPPQGPMGVPLGQERWRRSADTAGELADVNEGIHVREERLGHARAEAQAAMAPLEDGGAGLVPRERDDVEPHAGDLDDMVPELPGAEALLLAKG